MMPRLRRRYQVFVSSTFLDLSGQRDVAIREVVRLDCFPAGMEFFPGSARDPLENVRTQIDDSDLYLLITGFRYGTIPRGQSMSFTELEYEYAFSRGMPILWISYAGGVDDQLASESTQHMFRLADFKYKLEQQQAPNHCATDADLVSKLRSGLEALVEEHAGRLTGWFRPSGEGFSQYAATEPAWPLLHRSLRVSVSFSPRKGGPAYWRGAVFLPWRAIFRVVASRCESDHHIDDSYFAEAIGELADQLAYVDVPEAPGGRVGRVEGCDDLLIKLRHDGLIKRYSSAVVDGRRRFCLTLEGKALSRVLHDEVMAARTK